MHGMKGIKKMVEVDSALSSEIERQKKIAMRNRDRMHWIILGSFVSGVIGAVVWLCLFPGPRPRDVVGTAVGSGILVGILLNILLHKHEAKCPVCGYDWEIDDHGETHMLTWNCCPSCGLKMVEEQKPE
jgi:hypothetical protein